MIYTVLADYGRLDYDLITDGRLFSSFPEGLKSYIQSPSSNEVRVSRLGGYLLLYRAVRYLFAKEDFEIEFSESGKPFFSGKAGEVKFNISHSGGLVAVSVSDDGGEVGCDIQEEVDAERAGRISRRFPTEGLGELSSTSPVYIFGAFSADGECMFAAIPPSSLKTGDPERIFTDGWSLTEAIVKCHGGGFCRHAEIMSERSLYAAETVGLSYRGKRFSLSTAVKIK